MDEMEFIYRTTWILVVIFFLLVAVFVFFYMSNGSMEKEEISPINLSNYTSPCISWKTVKKDDKEIVNIMREIVNVI